MKRAVKVIVHAFILLTIGLVFSLLVTWLSIWLYDNPNTPSWQRHAFAIPYFEWVDKSRSGWMRLSEEPAARVWHVDIVYNNRKIPVQVRYRANKAIDGNEYGFKPDLFPDWAPIYPTPSDPEFNTGERRLVQCNGWPFVAWRGSATSDAWYNNIACTSAIPNDFSSSMDSWYKLVLFPLMPMFPGAFYNAVLWAILLWCAFGIVCTIRKRTIQAIRSRRGLCPRCAYNITGLSTCPECGQSVQHTPTIEA